MNERIKALRLSLGLSQEEFGKLIGLKKSGVCAIEAGNRRVTEKHLKMLKQSEYPINTDWILTGEGTMFLETEKNEQIMKYIQTILTQDTEDFRRKLISKLCELSQEQWESLENLLNGLKF